MTSEGKTFCTDFQVRDYELDLQGVVNNAVYMHYFEHARHTMFNRLGVGFADWANRGLDFTIVHSELEFKHPLMANDEFFVQTQIRPLGRIRVGFDQVIYRKCDHRLIARSLNTCVCLDKATRKPVMPALLRQLIDTYSTKQ